MMVAQQYEGQIVKSPTQKLVQMISKLKVQIKANNSPDPEFINHLKWQYGIIERELQRRGIIDQRKKRQQQAQADQPSINNHASGHNQKSQTESQQISDKFDNISSDTPKEVQPEAIIMNASGETKNEGTSTMESKSDPIVIKNDPTNKSNINNYKSLGKSVGVGALLMGIGGYFLGDKLKKNPWAFAFGLAVVGGMGGFVYESYMIKKKVREMAQGTATK